jgi:hypothetical protein
MANPYYIPVDYTIKGPGVAESMQQGMAFASDLKSAKLKQQEMQRIEDMFKKKDRFMDMYEDLTKARDKSYEKQTEMALKRIEKLKAEGKDYSDTLDYLNASKEERDQAYRDMTIVGQTMGHIQAPKEPTSKMVYDRQLNKTVARTQDQINAEPDRYGAVSEYTTLVEQQGQLPEYPGAPGGVPAMGSTQPTSTGAPTPAGTTIPTGRVSPTKQLEEMPVAEPGETFVDLNPAAGQPKQIRSQLELSGREKEAEELGKKSKERVDGVSASRTARNKSLDALAGLEQYSKNSVGGTGPLATALGSKKYVSEDLQKLDALFADIQLDKVKQFAKDAGARAIDSNTERKALKSTVASIVNDDNVNREVLVNAIESTTLMDYAGREQEAYIQKYGTLNGYKPTVGKMQVMFDREAPVGTPPVVVPKSQRKDYQQQGFVTPKVYKQMLKDGTVGVIEPMAEESAPVAPQTPATSSQYDFVPGQGLVPRQ